MTSQPDRGRGHPVTDARAKPYYVSYSYADDLGLPRSGSDTVLAASRAAAMSKIREKIGERDLRFHVVRSEAPAAPPKRRIGHYVVVGFSLLMLLQLFAGQIGR